MLPECTGYNLKNLRVNLVNSCLSNRKRTIVDFSAARPRYAGSRSSPRHPATPTMDQNVGYDGGWKNHILLPFTSLRGYQRESGNKSHKDYRTHVGFAGWLALFFFKTKHAVYKAAPLAATMFRVIYGWSTRCAQCGCKVVSPG